MMLENSVMKLVRLHFKLKDHISNLPLYHGPHLYAMFKKMIRNHEFFQNTAIIPFSFGLTHLIPEERIYVILLCYHERYAEELLDSISKFPKIDGKGFSSSSIDLIEYELFDMESLIKEEMHHISSLCNLSHITLCFYTPLRLKRPEKYKERGHRFFDLDLFFNNRPTLKELFKSLAYRIPIKGVRINISQDLVICDCKGFWIDLPYSQEKTLGGFIGDLKIKGGFNQELLESLVLAQYFGLGKNRAFGFGYFTIEQSPNIFNQTLSFRDYLFRRITSNQGLHNSISSLKSRAPGIDKIELSDILSLPDRVAKKLSDQLQNDSYAFSRLKSVSIKKEDGGFRELRIPVLFDRIVEKSIMIHLEDPIDRLLSISVYSYRKGHGVKKAVKKAFNIIKKGGYKALKADILHYFDSIQREELFKMLRVFLRDRKLEVLISRWLDNLQDQAVDGIPQGSPLSPLLSNLYLDYLDKELIKKGYFYFRFGDDLLVLFKEDRYKSVLETIERILKHLNLRLNKEKVISFREGEPVEFLGHQISQKRLASLGREKIGSKDNWKRLFSEDFIEGISIYITKRDYGAYSDGSNLIIKREDKEVVEKIPWKIIKDITIVGRSFFSNGVIFRCLYENIPVHFITIYGKYVGSIISDTADHTGSLEEEQKRFLKDNSKVLEFSKEIISSKLHNSYTLLKRNNIEALKLKELIIKVEKCKDLKTLRGYEGQGAKYYFEKMQELFRPFEFNGRVYNPPDSEVNVMLSIGYTLTYFRVAHALKKKGLNPYIGFLHRGRGNHFALASDLMEELRHLTERLVLRLIHKNILTPTNFTRKKVGENTRIILNQDSFPLFIQNFEEIFRSRMSYAGKKLSYYEYLDEMANKLRRMLILDVPYSALRIR